MGTEEVIFAMLIASALSMGILGLYGMQYYRRVPAALPYSLLMFTSTGWAVLYACDLASVSLQSKVLFHNLRFLFLPFMPVLELWLVIEFVNRREWFTKGRAVLLLVIPVLAMVLALTSQYHSLFRYQFGIDTSGNFPVLYYATGPFFDLLNLYSLVLLIITLAILLSETRRTKTLRDVRTILVFIALAFPTMVNYLFLFGYTPIPWINLAAPLLWIPAGLYTLAIFRYRFLSIVLVARERLIDTMSTLLLVLDRENRVIDANPAAGSFFSLPQGAVPGIPLEDAVKDWPEFIDMCRSRDTRKSELVWKGTGGTRTFIITMDLLHMLPGQSEGALVLLQDITDRKLMEETLQRSEALLKRTGMIGKVGGWELDAETRQVTWTEETYRIHEVPPMETPPLWDAIHFFHPDDRKRLSEAIQRAITEGEPYDMEIRFITAKGRHLWTRTVCQPEVAGGRVTRLIGTFQDITERKQAELQRELLIRELKAKNAELERFTYTVSHDLRSPLITIHGFAGQLEEDIRINDTELMLQDIKRIGTAVQTMDVLLQDLLTLSRIGRVANPPQEVSFSEIARETVSLLEGIIRKRGVAVTVMPDMPVVNVDRVRVREALANLVENAVKFMGDQPNPAIDIGIRESESGPVFFVRDNGKGIDPANHERIFMLFEKLDSKAEGHGAGLAIVRRIIEVHGGSIWVESEGKGKGSTFCFTLPVAGTSTSVDTHVRERGE